MEDAFSHLNVVIICGQTGTELWPLARRKTPRETIVFPGEDESLLASAIRRTRPLTESPIVFICPAQIEADIREGIAASRLLRADEYEIVIEPESRGTAFSISLVAAALRRRDPNSVMLAMPSHLVADVDERWEQAMARGYRAAEADLISVIGVPSRQSTSPHDFIRPGATVKEVPGVQIVADYLQAPNPTQAARYVSLGLMWSSGIMIMRANTVLAQLVHVSKKPVGPSAAELGRIAETASFLASIGHESWYSPEAKSLIKSLPEADLDDIVLAYSDDAVVVPTSIEVTGISTLADFDDLAIPNAADNRMMGRAFEIGSENTTIYSDDRLALALGCKNLMIVSTRDSVLVASKDSLDSMSEVVPKLIEAEAPEADRSTVSAHSWGRATTILETPASTTRLIELLDGKTIPEYASKERSERWIVLEGSVTCIDGYGTRAIRTGGHMEFKPNERHALQNSSGAKAWLVRVDF